MESIRRRNGVVAKSWFRCSKNLFTIVVLAAGCTPSYPQDSAAPASNTETFSVELFAATISGLPRCVPRLAGTTAFVQSPPGLWQCSGSGWTAIACTKSLAGAVAYASANQTLWACVSGSWTKVPLPEGSPGPTGPQGPQGLPGQDGTSCTVLDNGDGTKTISCGDGTSATVNNGAPGADGTSCTVTVQTDGSKLIACGSTSAVVNDGANGTPGSNGVSCWDLNGNGACDLTSEDKNGDSVCSAADCQGATGATGAPGATGATGTAGLNSLIRITLEAAGSNCATGGQKIEVGLDENGNGSLDSGEVTDAKYVCNGTGAGPDGGTDSTPPYFFGADMAIAYSDRYVTLTWSAAGDDVTPAFNIVYDICVSTSSGACATNFLVAATTNPGATLWNVGNLKAGISYYFLVRARDQAANRESNLVELQAQPKLPSAQHSLGVGEDHSCAVLADGTARCWGSNVIGQLGNGTTTSSPTMVPVSDLATAVALVGGKLHTCALLTDGTARCWGYNGYGQLGDGTTVPRATPITVSGLSDAVALVAGGAHTCALLANGTVRCWGYNGFGQLGDGTTYPRTTPIAVSGLGSAVSLAGGENHTCALLANGTARCWGYNAHGQLGNPSTDNRLTPVAVSSLSGAVSLAAGYGHTCALLANGTARCWGYNAYGQLGNGSTTNTTTPVAVSGLSGAVSLVAGTAHTCALLADATAYCWGYNVYGQLGDGTTNDTPTPIAVQGGHGSLLGLASGPFAGHTCAVTSDATGLCWGENGFGQLGNGTVTSTPPYGIPYPVAVSSLSGIAF